MTGRRFPRVASLRNGAGVRAHLETLGCPLPCDDDILPAPVSPLAEPLSLGSVGPTLANRFVMQPMEGWDGTTDGRPSDLTRRRWQRFGTSGAAWIWGGEAVAVVPEGRANPNQLVINEDTVGEIGELRRLLIDAAHQTGGPTPFVGLQLTHSGRWCRPDTHGFAPHLAYRHPMLDRRAGKPGDEAVMSDGEIEVLIEHFARAALLAAEAGFAFVDIKHCHGYLLHEFLSARARPGTYGGPSLAERTRLLFAVVDAVRRAAPEIAIAVRLSAFDVVPFRAGPGTDEPGPGEPEPHPLPYTFGFGLDMDAPLQVDLTEPIELVRQLMQTGITWVNITGSSPYYAAHTQRPAAIPPTDGYPPPEDPLVGVARLLCAARDVKQAVPEAIVVSTGWTYLQDFLPLIAQACVREGWFDAVGLGRMALSYPDLPADVLAGRKPDRKRICRTFSDCTTGPRNGLVSGCYPLDPFYKARPERRLVEQAKRT
ncbi:MAG: NADH:flavin oxidoreductase [Pseudomonadota bacterium]